jgi:hypothetical protein
MWNKNNVRLFVLPIGFQLNKLRKATKIPTLQTTMISAELDRTPVNFLERSSPLQVEEREKFSQLYRAF